MIPTTATPSASGPMRYFVPERYLARKSSDQSVVDEAEKAWQAATEQYREYLRSVMHLMPGSVRELAQACFHGAELMASKTRVVSIASSHPTASQSPLPTFSVFLVEEDGTPISLTYFLWDGTFSHQAKDGWPVSTQKVVWLCEEMEARQGPGELWFRHKILLSNGTVLEIPFTDAFLMRSVPTKEAAAE